MDLNRKVIASKEDLDAKKAYKKRMRAERLEALRQEKIKEAKQQGRNVDDNDEQKEKVVKKEAMKSISQSELSQQFLKEFKDGEVEDDVHRWLKIKNRGSVVFQELFKK